METGTENLRPWSGIAPWPQHELNALGRPWGDTSSTRLLIDSLADSD
jgi:hypothetical protein